MKRFLNILKMITKNKKNITLQNIDTITKI